MVIRHFHKHDASRWRKCVIVIDHKSYTKIDDTIKNKWKKEGPKKIIQKNSLEVIINEKILDGCEGTYERTINIADILSFAKPSAIVSNKLKER